MYFGQSIKIERKLREFWGLTARRYTENSNPNLVRKNRHNFTLIHMSDSPT